nr:MAG TPA: hypothetical protein [Caudoviricetes sp.]
MLVPRTIFTNRKDRRLLGFRALTVFRFGVQCHLA